LSKKEKGIGRRGEVGRVAVNSFFWWWRHLQKKERKTPNFGRKKLTKDTPAEKRPPSPFIADQEKEKPVKRKKTGAVQRHSAKGGKEGRGAEKGEGKKNDQLIPSLARNRPKKRKKKSGRHKGGEREKKGGAQRELVVRHPGQRGKEKDDDPLPIEREKIEKRKEGERSSNRIYSFSARH